MGAAEVAERLDEPADELHPYVLYAADRVFRVVLEALAHIEDWEPWPPFSRGYHVNLSPTFSLTVGARGLTAGEGEEIWARLRRAPDLAAKLQFALWAAYFEAGGQPATRVWTSLSSLMRRLGYTPHASGGSNARDLHLVADTLAAMFGVGVSGRWTDPGHHKERSVSGPLWQDGLVAAERREGRRERVWIAHQPGLWFTDAAWQARNGFLGRVSAALLELDAARDKWPIRVGAAYAWLARANLSASPSLTLRVCALVKQTGAAAKYQGRPAQLRARIEAAHDRLVAAGLLRQWEWLPGRSGSAGGWLEGSIRAEWIDAIPPLACSGTTPRVQGDHPSRVIREIEKHPNKSNSFKGRPLTLRAGAASSVPAARRPATREVA